MTLIQALLRRLTSQQPAAVRTLVPLQPEHLKAVSGGAGTNLPRSGY